MSAPYEIVAGPMDLYLGAANAAKPYVDATPSAATWTGLGATRAGNYDEEGVHITHEQTVEGFRPLGSTGIRKVWRTAEVMHLELVVYDITAEVYRRALNEAAITTTAAGSGIPGSKRISNLMGMDVALVAVLARANYSPYGDGWKLQHWLPVCWQDGDAEPIYRKGKPVGLKLHYSTLDDPTNGFGVSEFQTATAL